MTISCQQHVSHIELYQDNIYHADEQARKIYEKLKAAATSPIPGQGKTISRTIYQGIIYHLVEQEWKMYGKLKAVATSFIHVQMLS